MTADEEKAALLRAVCESPGDDLPRLAYADHCEEAGESVVSNYIRASIEVHHFPDAPDSLSRYEHAWESLRASIDVRLTDHVPHWINDATRTNGVAWVMRRGFLDTILCPLSWFWGQGDDQFSRLFRTCPVVAVRVRDKEPARRMIATTRGVSVTTFHHFWNAEVPAIVQFFQERGIGREDSSRARYIPEELFLDPGCGLSDGSGSPTLFDSREDAFAGLSLCLVNRGRMLAGLPPL